MSALPAWNGSEVNGMQKLADTSDHNDDHSDRFSNLDSGNDCLSSHPLKADGPLYIPNQGIERYHSALRNLIPIRSRTKNKHEINVDKAGLFSYVLCTWFSKLMFKAHRKGLVEEDIPNASPFDSCDRNVQRLGMFWKEELHKHGPNGASFARAVWRFTRTRLIADWLALTISCMLGFLTPMILMRKLLEFAEDPEADVQTGLIWAASLTLCELFRIFFFSWRWVLSSRTSVRLRSACLGLMYQKIIRLNNFEEKSMGQLINIFANDSQRIFDMVLFGPTIIGGPMVLICGVVYVLNILGPWALFGILVFVAFYPVQLFISRTSGLLRGKTVVISDKRISLMSEILTCIKTIKMNAWEESFEDQVNRIRLNEQKLIEKTAYLTTFGLSLTPTIPIISAIVTFLAQISSGNSLTAAQAFPVQALCSSSVHNVMRALRAFYEARIGLQRIQRCLLIEETTQTIQLPTDRAQAISIGEATFTRGSNWCYTINQLTKRLKKKRKRDAEADIEAAEKSNKDANQLVEYPPVLHDVNFCAPKGHLIGVCGPVGSGKSSLLLAILGQMRLIRGQLAREGSCAYVSQQAWITNGTLRDNILFGQAFVSRRYYKVINSCALIDDFNQLPGGDLTEIGERGVNLSGGQKQRVALARALYANKDLYLLDDPLSAVDVSVGARIFENYIQGELRNKTVVLVTHQIQYLGHCDQVYVMKDGHVSEQGTHEELLKLGREYASMVKQISSDNPSKVSADTEIPSPKSERVSLNVNATTKLKEDNLHQSPKDGAGEQIIVNEPSNFGTLKTDTYYKYITAAGGYLVAVLVLLVFLINAGSMAFSSWWLATWIKAGGGNITFEINNRTITSKNLADNPDYAYYQTIYGSSIILILLTCGIRCLVFTKATIHASSALHKELFKKVFYSPMLFFESNPIGRMQNLFSRDMDEVDTRLPSTLENITQNFWSVAFAIMFICIVFPWFLIAFIPLSMIYYFVSRIFRKGIRDLKRIENSTRSPVFSSLVETLQGLNTIHAFNKEADYTQRFFKLYDLNATCNYLWNVGMRWLAVRVDLLAALTTSITAFLVVALHGAVAPAMAGLALSYSWHISGILEYTTRLISETETRFISVERILAYVNSAISEDKTETTELTPLWPTQGHICFENVSLSYRKNLPNVLHNISFNISPGEKIGIVGRTGSGKSSLSAALFRLVEISNGCIKLDGVDVSEISLKDLRSKISIIPQDPVLFAGSIRHNLDRKNEYSDKKVWEVLSKTMLLERVSAMPFKLNTDVGTGSTGLSVGECQLLCLARALLKNSKVLILDEATASIDPETEAAVQTTIQREFKDCTVLIIAHRLSTITNCDRIMVMDEGKVIELDTPGELLANPSSTFARMMAASDVSIKKI